MKELLKFIITTIIFTGLISFIYFALVMGDRTDEYNEYLEWLELEKERKENEKRGKRNS